MIDILLCSSYYIAYEPMKGAREQPYAPLGILYLASYLREKSNFSVGVFDATFSDGIPAFEKVLQQMKPPIVGIQGFITTRSHTIEMIRIAKKAGSVVVVGGADPSSSWEDYLRWGADYVAVGEGELTLVNLMNYLEGRADTTPPENIPGLVYVSNGTIHQTGSYLRIEDLDSIPFPAYDLIDVEQYLATWYKYNGYTSMHILTSRGCPFSCAWCSKAVFGKSFRQRSVENVIEEIRLLHNKYHPDHLTIEDDTFGLNKKWLSRWCDIMRKEKFNIKFRCFSRVDIVNKEMLQQLKTSGCSHIHLGVESGSQRILDSMNKGTKVEDIYRSSKLIKDMEIGLGYFIMFGYLGETFDDIHKTEQLIFDIVPDTLGLSIAHPIPGTAFYDHVKNQHLLFDYNEKEQFETNRRLQFKATYPNQYYLHLIRYIEYRFLLIKETQHVRKAMLTISAVLEFIFLQVFERLWRLKFKRLK